MLSAVRPRLRLPGCRFPPFLCVPLRESFINSRQKRVVVAVEARGWSPLSRLGIWSSVGWGILTFGVSYGSDVDGEELGGGNNYPRKRYRGQWGLHPRSRRGAIRLVGGKAVERSASCTHGQNYIHTLNGLDQFDRKRNVPENYCVEKKPNGFQNDVRFEP